MTQQGHETWKTAEGWDDEVESGDEVQSKVLRQILFFVFLAVVLLILSQAAHPQSPEGIPAHQPAFVLSIEDDLISLQSNDASIKSILEELSSRTNIQVKVEIPAIAKVTLVFDRLSLPEVLQRLGKYVNYGYVEHWEEGKLRISTITVHSLKVATLPAEPSADATRVQGGPTPNTPPVKALEMNIDPSQYLREKRRPHAADY